MTQEQEDYAQSIVKTLRFDHRRNWSEIIDRVKDAMQAHDQLDADRAIDARQADRERSTPSDD